MARTIGSYGPKTMEAIRKAGLRLIFEHGYSAMSLRQLAAAVGIQAGSLYNHISTKQELLFDLVQDHINELLRQLELALQGKKRPAEQLSAFVEFHVTYHMTKKREVFIANSELRSLEPKNYDAIVKLRGAYERRLADILAEGVSEGTFEVVDIQVATFAILALLTGICTWYRPGGRLTREAIVAAHEKLVLSSVTPGATANLARTGLARTSPARTGTGPVRKKSGSPRGVAPGQPRD
jgi:AcrR family transcriptional regulator